MHREYFSLEVSNIDWVDDDGEPTTPQVTVEFEDGREQLIAQLSGSDGELLGDSDVDVSYRLQGSVDDTETTGVVAITDRLTGDYVCELNAPASDVLPFIAAARRYGEQTGDGDHYRVVMRVDGEEVITYEKRTFLVYSRDGDLLRQHSLIPSGVEI